MCICEVRWVELPFYLMFLHRFSPGRYTAGDVSPRGELDRRGAVMDESTLTFLLLINPDFSSLVSFAARFYMFAY